MNIIGSITYYSRLIKSELINQIELIKKFFPWIINLKFQQWSTDQWLYFVEQNISPINQSIKIIDLLSTLIRIPEQKTKE